MLQLFELNENYELIITPEAMAIKVFNDIMHKYKNKDYGVAELTYVYFMIDFRSDFGKITDKDLRHSIVLENLVNSDKIKIDKKTKDAMDFYIEHQPSMSYKHLQSVHKAMTTLQESLESINLTQQALNPITGEISDVYDTLALNRITQIIEKSPKLIAAIKEMEKQVKTELQDSTATRGSGEKSIYEDE